MREICKQLDTHAWRMFWVVLPQSSVKDTIEFARIMPFFLMERMWVYPQFQIILSIICDDRCAPLFKGIRDNVVFLDIVWDEKWVMEEANTPATMMGMFQGRIQLIHPLV